MDFYNSNAFVPSYSSSFVGYYVTNYQDVLNAAEATITNDAQTQYILPQLGGYYIKPACYTPYTGTTLA